jgi:hypothetical protein
MCVNPGWMIAPPGLIIRLAAGRVPGSANGIDHQFERRFCWFFSKGISCPALSPSPTSLLGSFLLGLDDLIEKSVRVEADRLCEFEQLDDIDAALAALDI